jgi:hypothetical protein
VGPWQSSRRGGEKHPIEESKAAPFDLPPKDIQLMSEHDDLEILGGGAPPVRNEHSEQNSNPRYISDRSIALLRSSG